MAAASAVPRPRVQHAADLRTPDILALAQIVIVDTLLAIQTELALAGAAELRHHGPGAELLPQVMAEAADVETRRDRHPNFRCGWALSLPGRRGVGGWRRRDQVGAFAL